MLCERQMHNRESPRPIKEFEERVTPVLTMRHRSYFDSVKNVLLSDLAIEFSSSSVPFAFERTPRNQPNAFIGVHCAHPLRILISASTPDRDGSRWPIRTSGSSS